MQQQRIKSMLVRRLKLKKSTRTWGMLMFSYDMMNTVTTTTKTTTLSILKYFFFFLNGIKVKNKKHSPHQKATSFDRFTKLTLLHSTNITVANNLIHLNLTLSKSIFHEKRNFPQSFWNPMVSDLSLFTTFTIISTPQT